MNDHTTAVDRPEVDDPRVLALAVARQQMAYESPFNFVCPPWDGLSEQEQHLSLLDARNYLRAALKAGLVPAVVPSVGVPALRDRIRRAVCEAEGFMWDSDMLEPDEYGDVADAVLAVLPEPADRAAALNEGADAVFALDYDAMVGEEGDENLGSMREAWDLGTIHAEKLLRHLADEAAVVPPPALTEEGRLRAQVEVLQQDAERDQGLAKVGARCMRDGHQGLIEQGRLVLEGWRFALSTGLGLGTGAPWEAIHERVTELGLPPIDQDPVARRLGLVPDAAGVRAACSGECDPSTGAFEHGPACHDDRRERYVHALVEPGPWESVGIEALAEAVMAVADAELAAVLTEAADWFDGHSFTRFFGHQVATELRRLAGGAAGSSSPEFPDPKFKETAGNLNSAGEAAPDNTETPQGEPESPFQVWPLARVLAQVRCGSQDWTWDEEWADLDRRHVATGYLDKLEQEIRANGITMPVLIGTDGRLWDGHHRLRLAVRIGIGYVPVELTAPAVEAQQGEGPH